MPKSMREVKFQFSSAFLIPNVVWVVNEKSEFGRQNRDKREENSPQYISKGEKDYILGSASVNLCVKQRKYGGKGKKMLYLATLFPF